MIEIKQLSSINFPAFVARSSRKLDATRVRNAKRRKGGDAQDGHAVAQKPGFSLKNTFANDLTSRVERNYH